MKRERLFAWIGSTILKILFLTIRLRFDDQTGLTRNTLSGPCLICFWHNRILGITLAFRKKYPKDQRPDLTVLTSSSKDGEILAHFVAAFGMKAIRGSSSRRGARALHELIRLVNEGKDIAITPDGPRGPRYALAPGVVLLAQATGATILPAHAHFSRCVRMNTWDGFIIPLPFSTISVTVNEGITIPKNLTEEEFEQARKKLEDQLRNAAD